MLWCLAQLLPHIRCSTNVGGIKEKRWGEREAEREDRNYSARAKPPPEVPCDRLTLTPTDLSMTMVNPE